MSDLVECWASLQVIISTYCSDQSTYRDHSFVRSGPFIESFHIIILAEILTVVLLNYLIIWNKLWRYQFADTIDMFNYSLLFGIQELNEVVNQLRRESRDSSKFQMLKVRILQINFLQNLKMLLQQSLCIAMLQGLKWQNQIAWFVRVPSEILRR